MTEFLGHKIEGATFQAFVDKLHAALPKGSNILRVTLSNSLMDLLKKELNQDNLINTCWRIAGNMNKLKDQETVNAWRRQDEFEWVPVQVQEVTTEKAMRGLHNVFVFEALAGTMASMKFAQTWSFKKTRYLATFKDPKSNGFGFGKSRLNARGEQKGKLLLNDFRQFCGLRCFLLIDPEESTYEPCAVEVGHSSATTLFNRELIRRRDRAENDCIKQLGVFECYHCPYGTDNCEIATHPVTYETGECGQCSKKAFFDPQEIQYENMCINCAYEARRK